MKKVYFVVDADDSPLYLGEPWLDGMCLYDENPRMATVFFDKKVAKSAIAISKEYAKKNRLSAIWRVKVWKVVEHELTGLIVG